MNLFSPRVLLTYRQSNSEADGPVVREEYATNTYVGSADMRTAAPARLRALAFVVHAELAENDVTQGLSRRDAEPEINDRFGAVDTSTDSGDAY